MDAIDQLALLHKALKGSEQAGHKYKSRKLVGSKWVYVYGKDSFEHHRLMAASHGIEAKGHMETAEDIGDSPDSRLRPMKRKAEAAAKRHNAKAQHHLTEALRRHDVKKHGPWNDTMPTEAEARDYHVSETQPKGALEKWQAAAFEAARNEQYPNRRAMHKALKGSEQAGHKYKSRKRGAKGAWVYDYGDTEHKIAAERDDARRRNPPQSKKALQQAAARKRALNAARRKADSDAADIRSQAEAAPRIAARKAADDAEYDRLWSEMQAKEASGNSVERNRNIYGQFPKGAKWKKPSKGVLATARASIREAIDAAVKHGHSPFDGAGRYARSTFSSGSLATR